MANKNLREIFQVISENINLGDKFKIEDVPELELPENFSDDFHSNFLTLTSAKNNPELMAHFKGKYLSSTDLKIKKGFINAGGTEEEFVALKEQEPDSLKLVDLVFSNLKERKSFDKTNGGSKEFEQYKKDTIKQIESLKLEIGNSETTFTSKLAEKEESWAKRYTESKINELLSGQTFDSGLPKEDLMYLINKKIDSSKYLIKIQDDYSFKVFDKENPDALALKDGKELQLSEVIAEVSEQYIKKNDGKQPEKKTVVVETNSTAKGDGRFIVGHPNYGK